MKYEELLHSIQSYEKITVFRHLSPDGDAVFSQAALAIFLKENFPEKKVKQCGLQSFDLYDNCEKVSSSFIKGSLAIILDCGSTSRIDDERYSTADKIIKIDHHPDLEKYADLNYTDTSASSTSEILTDILFSRAFKGYQISEEVCRLLYGGILTDSLNFTTSNSTSKTLERASRLVSHGGFHMSDVAEWVFERDLGEFQKLNLFTSYFKVNGKHGHVLLGKKELKKIGFDHRDAKNNITQFGNIRELNVWSVFAYNEKEGTYEVSLRSKRNYPINGFAVEYGGGGHPNAAGIKGLSLRQCRELIDKLDAYSIQ